MTETEAGILRALETALEDQSLEKLGVAVSGGSDSTALLHGLKAVLGDRVQLFVATVDHGLRPEAAAEAEAVAATAVTLSLTHDTLKWTGWDGAGNLQDQARRARYGLLAQWAGARGLDAVALGHTADDQAETLLMRLGRSSGIDGLSGMAPVREVDGVRFLRPLLGVTRAELRAYLTGRGIGWIDDPSNENENFTRIRARRALGELGDLGISARGLADVTANLAEAREALAYFAHDAACALVRIDGGDVLVDIAAFIALPAETQRRLLVHAFGWINQRAYPPRRAPVGDALAAIAEMRPVTLAGCRVLHGGESFRICREFNAVRDEVCPVDGLWDGRWRITGDTLAGAEIRPLGEAGLAQCPTWRETGRPHAALIATPALWQGGELVAAPLAGTGGSWRADLSSGEDSFFTTLLSH